LRKKENRVVSGAPALANLINNGEKIDKKAKKKAEPKPCLFHLPELLPKALTQAD